MKYSTLSILFFCLIVFCSCKKFKTNQLEWSEYEAYRLAELDVRPDGKSGFEKLDSSITGVAFRNYLPSEDMARNRNYLNGSGVAAGDIDGDGWVDLYFTRLNGPNKLYKNLGGLKFEDVTETAGVAHEDFYSTGAVFADINGNGHLDLLVTSMHRENTLYLNDGTGKFTKKEDSGLGKAKGSMTMALADITGNGYPDLYISNFKEQPVTSMFPPSEFIRDKIVREENDSFELIPPFDEHYYILEDVEQGPTLHELGEKDELYLNNGDGTFEKATDLKNRFLDKDGSPKGLFADWGLDAKFQDLNDDGLPDLYVANDVWTPDRVWLNQGNGIFQLISDEAIKRYSFSSMGVDFSDLNRDGLTDIFVVEMLDPEHQRRISQMPTFSSVFINTAELNDELPYRHNRNSLYLNRGDNTYADISWLSGVAASGWSWATRFMDVTLNGYEDILITTGFPLDVLDMDSQQQIRTESRNVQEESEAIDLHQRNRAFRNNRDLTFTDRSTAWGFTEEDVSHGMALADLDNDGALDVIINRLNREAAVYRNTSGSPRIAVRLKGQDTNTQAIGSKVVLEGGPVNSQSKQVTSGGDYLSGSDPLVMFAADPDNPDHRLIITWPDGMQSRIDSVQTNRIYEVDESRIGKEAPVKPSREAPAPLFSDLSESLAHVHHESEFDDFQIQPLLPVRLSRQGPGVAWLDVTGNGREDLLIGSGRGGEPAVYENGPDGRLRRTRIEGLTVPADGDQTGLAGWTEAGRTHLVIGLANYEQGSTRVASAVHLQLENGRVVSADSLPGALSASGPVAVADYTGDGRMDLFLGGRFVPGQYPMDASSRLFRGSEEGFELDEANTRRLREIGMVSSGLFVDYNSDGEQDLLVATEWGSLRLFENRNGEFIERTGELDLEEHKGWWQGIATGDFTGNGYPDIVATNWGQNSPYQFTTPGQPLRMYYGDLSGDGLMDIIEAYHDEDIGGFVPRRRLSEFESIRNAFQNVGSNRKFAGSSLEEILRIDLNRLPSKEINTLEHMVFLNEEGAGFTAKSLPAEARFSAGFYAGVADMDNDGQEDIFLSQNNFAWREQPGRPDAGRGLWLKGDGRGNFTPVAGHESGVKVYGDQRGAALGDYTGDGRVDLAVSQNAGATRLFVNRGERPGIRVQLSGPAINRAGIGSGVRLVYEDGSNGPVRYIQAGSGYWSQNSSRPVLGMQDRPVAIEVFWYDGIIQTINLEEARNEIIIQYSNPEFESN